MPPCPSCHTPMTRSQNRGRGLCGRCYQHHRNAGTLDNIAPPPTRKTPIDHTITNCQTCDEPMAYRQTVGARRQRNATTCERCVRVEERGQQLDGKVHFGGREATLAEDGILDPVAIRRAADGDTTLRLTHRELTAAVTYLTRHDYSASEIAERLGCDERTVTRLRPTDAHPMPDPAETMAAA